MERPPRLQRSGHYTHTAAWQLRISFGQDRHTVSRTFEELCLLVRPCSRIETASMTNAAMIAAGIEIMRRIVFPTIYELIADLRISKSESNNAPADAENTE